MANKIFYPMKTWKWKGLPGHFIGVSDCIFRLCTMVGPFKISTVGAYYPKTFGRGDGKPNKHMETIGCNRHYETYVFVEASGNSEIDGEGIFLEDVPGKDPNKADELAEEMHLRMCEKYSKIEKYVRD